MVFKLCAAALKGAVRNLKGAPIFFFENMKYYSFFIEICLGVPRKNFVLFQGAASQKVWKPLLYNHGGIFDVLTENVEG